MTTAGIIILSALSIGIIYCFVQALFSEKEIDRYSWLQGQMILTMMLLVMTFGLILKKHELTNKLNGKCPEYEKIDNVYKLKQ